MIERLSHAGRTYRLFRQFGVARLACAWREVRFLATGYSGKQHLPPPYSIPFSHGAGEA